MPARAKFNGVSSKLPFPFVAGPLVASADANLVISGHAVRDY